MSEQGMSYEDALRSLAAAEGIEYIDCRVTPDWGSDRPVRHDLPREVGPSASGEPSRLIVRPATETVTAGVGLGADVPTPASLLNSAYEQLMLDPRHREAAARGMKVHTDALRLIEAEGIGYADAIKRVTG